MFKRNLLEIMKNLVRILVKPAVDYCDVVKFSTKLNLVFVIVLASVVGYPNRP